MNHVLILALAATLAHHPVGVLLRGADVQLAGHEAQATEVVVESDTIQVGPGSSATVKLGDKVVKLSEGAYDVRDGAILRKEGKGRGHRGRDCQHQHRSESKPHCEPDEEVE